MKSLKWTTLLAVCILGTGCIPFYMGDGPIDVAPKGSVIDGATGKPIEGARVWFVTCWCEKENASTSENPRLLGSSNSEGSFVGSVSFRKWRRWTGEGVACPTQRRFRVRISKVGYESFDYTNLLFTVPINMGRSYLDLGNISLLPVASTLNN